jgi:hypothetical protein
VLGPVLLLVLSVSLVYFGTPISRVVRAFSIRVLPHEADAKAIRALSLVLIFAVVAVLVVMIMYLFG